MGTHAADRDVPTQLIPVLDRLVILFVLAQVLTFPFVPLLPLAIAAAAAATPVRRSRARMWLLWLIGAVLALIVVAPFALGLLNAQFVDEGPPHHARP
jgi:hypothetical protein